MRVYHIIISIILLQNNLTILYIPLPFKHEQAELEVERLCDIIERATDALKNARQIKRDAQRELDEAARAAKHPPRAPTAHNVDSVNGNGNALGPVEQYYSDEEDDSDYTDSGGSDEEESDGEYDDDEEEENHNEEEESSGFDMGNEALEQVRYRLDTAKIDPNSPEGTKLLDELLIRLQNANVEIIDTELVNELIDELFEAEGGGGETNTFQKPHPKNPNQQHPVIRIHRNGKSLGWYQGQLDRRGYAREGEGSMYYDAGHECHGLWKNDEMVGRGVYQWSDGHVYDGEWVNGKRHGLGRFIRPDNVILFGRYVKGHHKGEGVRWSADRKEAQLVVDGVPKKGVSLAVAKDVATNLGFIDVLPPPV